MSKNPCSVAALVLAGTLVGCSTAEEVDRQERSTTSVVQIATAVSVGGQPLAPGVPDLVDARLTFRPHVAPPRSKPDEVKVAPRSKLEPRLERQVSAAEAARNGDANTEVIIALVDDRQLPQLPALLPNEPSDSPANTAVVMQRLLVVDGLEKAFSARTAALEKTLAADHGAAILGESWLTSTITAALPVGQIRALAARPEVAHVSARASGEKPPFSNNESDARSRTGTDPFFNMTLTAGSVGLLDTGVRKTHTLFNNPSHLGVLRDCVHGTSNNCTTGTGLNGDDPFWNHGTSSASELTANGVLGNSPRGMTAIKVNSYKVYDECPTAPGTCGYNRDAGDRGFRASIAVGDFIIDAEIQDFSDPDGVTSVAADRSFDLGAIVIAANGNAGPDEGTVRSPGDARKALGIGAYDVIDGTLQSYSGRGPTLDGRFKPDVLAPTNVKAASNSSKTALRVFGGTSAATPHAAGAAALIRDFLRLKGGFDLSPGQVYAFMINAGSLDAFNSASSFDNESGSGQLKLESPSSAKFFAGSFDMTPGNDAFIQLTLPAPTSKVEAAIWWPETSAGHNDMDLLLFNADGSNVGSSDSAAGVFEKVRDTTSRTGGTWGLEVINFRMATASQKVYWTLYVK